MILKLRSSNRLAFGALSGVQATTVAAGVGVGILLARGLGVDDYGKYVFALAVVQFMLIPLNFGLPTLVMREVAVLREEGEWALLSGLLRWSVILVAGVLALLAVGILLWNSVVPRGSGLYFFALALAGIWAYMRLAAGILRGMERVVWAALPDKVIRPLVLLVALLVLPLAIDLTPERAMAAHMFAAAAGLGAALWMLVRRYPPLPASVAPNYSATQWFRSVVPLGLHQGAGLLNSRIDVMMLGALASHQEVGLYGLAILVAGIAGMPQVIVNQINSPKFARLYAANDVLRIGHVARRSALVATCGGAIVLGGVASLGEPVIVRVVGEEFRGAATIALVACFGPTIAASFGAPGAALNMTGHEQVTAKIVWAFVIINIALNGILIAAFGGIGAAAATASTTVLNRAVLWNAARQKLLIRCDLFAVLRAR